MAIAQHVLQELWKRQSNNYLSYFQQRAKLHKEEPNMKVGERYDY